ncbi:MAG: hypothetical protein WCP97_06355 [bacterium]
MSQADPIEILVVEDDFGNAALYRRALPLYGVNPTIVGTIREAKVQIEAHRTGRRTFSAVISDGGLPDGTANDLRQDLTRSGLLGSTVVATALPREFGGFVTVGKPFDLGALVGSVERIAANDRLRTERELRGGQPSDREFGRGGRR